MSARRITVVAALVLCLAPTARAGLYVRGAKDLVAIVEVMRHDLARAGPAGDGLFVVLVDPAPRTARSVATLGPTLGSLEGTRVLVAAVGGDLPAASAVQNLDAACRALAAEPVSGVRNLLGEIRRVARTYRRWDGPRHLLLLAMAGVAVEEDTEQTLRVLRRAGFSFSVATGEAAFSQPWRPSPARPEGFLLRATGHPDRKRDTVYASCETPFPDTPAAFDLDLAPGRFQLTEKHVRTTDPFALPSGFGYYHLARLANETGGRYFLYGYTSAKAGGFSISYEYGLLRLFAPDLRPRTTILAEIPGHPLARALYEVWGRLAQPRAGVIRRGPPVRAAGAGGRLRVTEEVDVTPNRALRLTFQGKGDAAGMRDQLERRLVVVEEGRRRLERAIESYRESHGNRIGAGDHRWMAQVELLRLQCLRVRFHLGQMRETLAEVRSAEFGNVTIRLCPRTIYRGSQPVVGESRPESPCQARFLDETVQATRRLEEIYAGTPWGHAAKLGELRRWFPSFTPKGGSRPVARSGAADPPKKPAKPRPRTGQPMSSGGGAATGGD